MKTCSQCQTSHADGKQFCRYCGAPLGERGEGKLDPTASVLARKLAILGGLGTLLLLGAGVAAYFLFFAGGGKATPLTQAGIYQGVLVAVTDCPREPGDKRACKSVDFKLADGKLVSAPMYMGVEMIVAGRCVNCAQEGAGFKSQVELHQQFTDAINNYFIPGAPIRATVSCGQDAGCYIKTAFISD